MRLGTTTITDTVNRALRLAADQQRARAKECLDTLSRAGLSPREDAWR
jgi:hypothetical protein